MVTGASGFLGRWVSALLSRAGADLVMAVRDQAAAATIVRELSIEAEVVGVDLSDAGAVEELLQKVKPVMIFNLAAYGVDVDENDVNEARRINVDLVRWLVEGLSRWGSDGWPGPRVVHAGSALEYGTAGGSLDEDGPATPTTDYGVTKLEGTRALLDQSRQAGLRAIVARLFTVYGPGEHATRLLPSLLRAADCRQRIPLTSGLQRRDFTFVRDAAEGLLRLGVSTPADSRVVNLATGRLTPVRDFVETAAPIIGLSEGLLDFGALGEARPEMHHDPVNIIQLRELTGWRPSTTVAEGIKLTVDFERSIA